MMSFLATETCSEVIMDHWARPPVPVRGNLAIAVHQAAIEEHAIEIRSFNRQEEKVFGLLFQSLRDFPVMRNKLMDHIDVKVTQANKPQGSKVWRALRNEVLNNPSTSIYDCIVTKIESFRQSDKSIPDFLQQLNDLFSSLPAPLAFSDSKKILQLRKGIHEKQSLFVKTLQANVAATYDSICDALIAEYHNEEAITAAMAHQLTDSTKNTFSSNEEKAAEHANFSHDFKGGHERKRRGYDQAPSAAKKHTGDDVTCYKCGRVGHKSDTCWSKTHVDGHSLKDAKRNKPDRFVDKKKSKKFGKKK